MIQLSILVPTVPSRIHFFYPRIMKELISQIEKSKYKKEIELLALFDNKIRTVGEKRQDLMNLSKGKYLTFIDDDDRINFDYIESIMDKISENPEADVIVFDSITKIEKGSPIHCKYGIEFEYGYINKEKSEWRGKPAHTMVWKSSIAKKYQFKNLQNGEDVDWVKRAHKDIKSQVRIEKVLYYYDANYKTTSETAGLSESVILRNSIITANSVIS